MTFWLECYHVATDEGWEGRNGTAQTEMLRSSHGSEGEMSKELIVKDLVCCAGEPELCPRGVGKPNEVPKQSKNGVRCIY